MSSVVSYSLLLVICFSSYSLQDPHLKGTMVEGHLGGNASIHCETEDNNQHGVYMYRHKPGEPKPQRIFFFYYDGTLTLNEDSNVEITIRGTFPSFTITFLNLTVTDTALYWCEFNYEAKITFSMITFLSVKVADGCIVLLDPPETTQSVTIDNDDEETTSAVTDFESAGRPTELSAKELYKVHLLRQIKKTDMDMDLIQLQLEEKRLAIKKAKLEIELLEHRLKDMKK
ncbi:uncharacterized protein [Paramisgurnus dabryanus]